VAGFATVFISTRTDEAALGAQARYPLVTVFLRNLR
jgi:hypothetical protein